MENTTQIYDTGYKKLFERREFVQMLVESFVPFKWVSKVDFSNIEQVKTSFIRDNYKKKESDVIYKLYLNNKVFYLYILLEFQSTVDKDMPFRFLSYTIDFYEYLKNKEKFEKYPVIFPILIYNGDEKWDVPDNIKDCINVFDRELEPYLPSLKYFKIIINEFSKRSLIKIHNILSAVFLIENLENSDEFLKYAEELVDIIHQEINPDIKKAFENWFKHMVNADKIPDFIDFNKINKEEARTMFANTIQRAKKEGVKEGSYQKSIEAANKMYEKGYSLEDISDITGLSVKELEKVLKK